MLDGEFVAVFGEECCVLAEALPNGFPLAVEAPDLTIDDAESYPVGIVYVDDNPEYSRCVNAATFEESILDRLVQVECEYILFHT